MHAPDATHLGIHDDMETVKIEAGEFCVLIKCNSRKLAEVIRKDYDGFISEKNEDYTVELDVTQEGVIKVENDLIHFNSGYNGFVNPKEHHARFSLGVYQKHCINLILWICFTFICNENNSILLHSAGLVHRGVAYLFTGVPEAGKSTISELSTHCSLLSDEHLVIAKRDGEYVAYGTGLGGEYFKLGKKRMKPKNDSAKVDKLFFIHKAAKNRIVKKKKSEAISDLLNQNFFDEISTGADVKMAYLNNVADFIENVDCYDLYFKKNNEFWKDIGRIESEKK